LLIIILKIIENNFDPNNTLIYNTLKIISLLKMVILKIIMKYIFVITNSFYIFAALKKLGVAKRSN
jgi:hypothetical protein